MAASISSAATTTTNSNSTPAAHPSKSLWDKLYEDKKDAWTNTAIDQELFKFHNILTDGKTGLDILIPMCGKSHIMLLFAEKGHCVTGIEWSSVAIKQFFEINSLEYGINLYKIGDTVMTVYTANNAAITIYCGDIFAFKEDNLGGFDCIFDHGSIGSFVPTKEKRTMYAQLMNFFTKPGGRILLSFFDYEHSEHPSIPFALTEEEVAILYKDNFNHPELLDEIDASKTADLFKSRQRADSLFPVWTLSRYSWKILFLVKQV